jgi:hypothetical protein
LIRRWVFVSPSTNSCELDWFLTKIFSCHEPADGAVIVVVQRHPVLAPSVLDPVV